MIPGGRRNGPCLMGATSTVAQQRVGAPVARVCPRRGVSPRVYTSEPRLILGISHQLYGPSKVALESRRY